jgi:pimeloyl-ACP methyl ester carboxylesterase
VTIPAASETLRSRFGWPEKLTEQLESSMIEMFYAPCEEFRRHPRPGMNDPVTAEVPTLVLQGMVDTQTAAGWGPLLASTLPRSQLAVFPETGHGAFIFSQCARDIAAAFVDDPGARVDVSCAAALTPAFLLPDGGWSKPSR